MYIHSPHSSFYCELIVSCYWLWKKEVGHTYLFEPLEQYCKYSLSKCYCYRVVQWNVVFFSWSHSCEDMEYTKRFLYFCRCKSRREFIKHIYQYTHVQNIGTVFRRSSTDCGKYSLLVYFSMLEAIDSFLETASFSDRLWKENSVFIRNVRLLRMERANWWIIVLLWYWSLRWFFHSLSVWQLWWKLIWVFITYGINAKCTLFY